MELDDIFENKRKYHERYRQSGHNEENRYHDNSYTTFHRNNSDNKWLFYLLKYRTNKTIRIFTKIAAVAVFTLIMLVVIVLFPFIMKFAYYISQNGLQGVADSITLFLDKLWKGFGK